MPFIIISSGLTIKVPTRGTTNWDNTMLTDTFQKISEHDHTAGGKGAQLGTGSLLDNAVSDAKLRLRNNNWLRGRNAAGTLDINLLKVGTDDRAEITPFLHSTATVALNNNEASPVDITGLLFNSAKAKSAIIHYAITRDADTDEEESGELHIVFSNSAWLLSQEFTGSTGVKISITAAGQLQYTSSNLSGHLTSKFHFLATSLGV